MNLILASIKTLLFLNALVKSRLTEEVSINQDGNLDQHRDLLTSRNNVIESNRDTGFNNNAYKYGLNRDKNVKVLTDKETSVKQNDTIKKPQNNNKEHYAKKRISYKKRRSLENNDNTEQTEEKKGGIFKSHEIERSNPGGDIELRLHARDDGWKKDPVAYTLRNMNRLDESGSNKIPKFLDPFYEPERVPKPELASDSLIEEIESYVKYAGASYCTIHSEQDSQCNYCKKFSKDTVTFPLESTLKIYGKSLKMHAIIVVDPKKEEIVLAYRGSDNISKLLGSKSDYLINYPDIPEAKVHAFFYKAVNCIHKKVTNKLTTMLRVHPDFRLVITGHSLGGSLATLSAPLIHRDVEIPYSQMRIVTYGQLRVGNLAYALWYNSLKIDFTRVVNESDGATSIPKYSKYWVHVQSEVHIENGVFYDCKTRKIEHPHCSLHKTSYFGIATKHGYVDKFTVSPDYCTGKSIFFKKEFYNR